MPRRAVVALGGAAIGIALLFTVWFAAFHVGFVQRADQRVFSGFFDLRHHAHVPRLASFIANLCDPFPYAYFCLIPPLIALARKRLPVAIAICAILLGANVTTHWLKPLLAQPRASSLLGGATWVSPASWPSGHATAAMSLALCLVLAVPARMRPAVAVLGAAFAVAVSYSFLTLGWHYPSDVFGGYLVAGCWTLLGIAAVAMLDARRSRAAESTPRRRLSVREALTPPALALVAALVLAALILITHPHQVFSYAHDHEGLVVGLAAIGAFGLTVATTVMLAARR